MKTSIGKRIIRLGDVTIAARELTASENRNQVLANRRAARKLAYIFSNSGLSETDVHGIPQFHADPSNPSRLIRVLNGVVESGRIVKGVFVELQDE